MNHDWVTVAFDERGRSRWVAREDGMFERMDAPAGIAITPDGSLLLVTGSVDFRITNGYAADFRTVAYRTDTGERVWSSNFDGDAEGDCLDIATGIALSPDGKLAYVTGESQPSPDDDAARTFSTVAYDVGTGHEVWHARLAESGADFRPLNIATSPDGRQVYVSGKTGLSSIVTLAYRGGSDVGAGAGTLLWKKSEDDISRAPGAELVIGGDMAMSPKGDTLFVLGSFTTTGVFRGPATVAYDALTGNRRYVARYTPTAPYTDYQPRAMTISPDGETVYVLGHSLEPGAPVAGTDDNWDFTTIAYDAGSGNQKWVSQVDIASGDAAFDIAAFPGGDQVVLTGRTGAPTYHVWGFDNQPPYVRAGLGERAATVTLNADTGATAWIDTFDGWVEDSDWPTYSPTATPNPEVIWRGTRVATSADGKRLYVLGSYSRNTNADVAKWIAGYSTGADLQEGDTMNYLVLVYTFN